MPSSHDHQNHASRQYRPSRHRPHLPHPHMPHMPGRRRNRQGAKSKPRMRKIQLRRQFLRQQDVTVVEEKTLKQAIAGTVVGNFMEWYDFGIYGYLAVTMASVFTSGLPKSMSLIVMLLGFAVSFLVRPLGGIVLGPLGDRVGRQKVLFLTMGMMVVSTALIGILPTSRQIGAWAIVPLYALQMVQGFSTGGEYSGATTYISEFSPDRKRGFYSAWLDMGSYIGSAVGAMMVALTTTIAEHGWGVDAMANGGWRIPYLLTIPLGVIAMALRSRIPETPQFAAHQDRQKEEQQELTHEAREAAWRRVPASDRPGTMMYVIKRHWRRLLIAVAIVAATNTAGYLLTSYMPTYLREEVGTSPTMAAAATAPVLIIMALCLPLIGHLSDIVGRKPVYSVAVISTFVLVYPAFQLLHHGTFWAIQGALAMLAIPVAFYAGVSASTLPALFPTESRFSGMGLSYNFAVSLFGGTSPLISQALITFTGNHDMPGFYIMFFAIFSGIATLVMRESSRAPLPGSMPTVGSDAEAKFLVRTQEMNPKIDTSTMPMPLVTVEIPAGQMLPQRPENIKPVKKDERKGKDADKSEGESKPGSSSASKAK
ncbi:MFS transporter [Bifidobacterium sp. ESL0763]|uniref:MFS transporter n=1 Tax=Bifidobacterium sp. ESL0763 TaxID=2983227 RepID=UPI0023F9E59C|nr:MFS transporter [Bifidobacterium sp. ESL0763]MDF7664439.1 MFS transporter [Bifidobacterium sp. ESL0763]